MDILHALNINDTTFKVHNSTEYHLDQYLYSTYGFEIYYRKRRGINNIHWLNILKEDGFTTPDLLYKGIYQAESRVQELDFHKFMLIPFVLYWTFGDDWYGLGFDGHEFVMQNNDGNAFLPTLIL